MARGTGNTNKTTKGYPRMTAGPCRNEYIHRLVAAALIGRELERDEEVHHRDHDKKNPRWNNLIVYGSKDHGWVSARQAFYMRRKDAELKREWDAFMDSEAERFNQTVKIARNEGGAWTNVDGLIAQRFSDFHSGTGEQPCS